MARWLRLLLVLAAMMVAVKAQAHLTPNSEMRMDIGSDRVAADLVIPLGDYALATGNPTDNGVASLNRARAYLTDRIGLKTPDGRAWQMTIEQIEFAQIAGPPDLHAVILFRPPPSTSTRKFNLDWRAIVDRRPGHFALVVAESDFAGGMIGSDRQLLGAVRSGQTLLAIDRGESSIFSGFRASLRLGMEHIAEGYDHLLFLLALLLPAPVMAMRGQWGRPRATRNAIVKLATIVSAFTIGHSATLIGAAVFGWRLPAQPVEVMIAVSILISAIHAWRPIFPGKESWVAAGFGLIHGLAFATVVARFGLGMEEKGLSILGFNLGIEIVQLAVVAVVMPPLMLLARTRAFPTVRRAGAVGAGLAATVWIIERTVGEGVSVNLYDRIGVWPLLLIGSAIMVLAATRQQRPSSAWHSRDR